MSMSETKINEVGRNAQENANLIWNAANSLFGAFKPHEYGLVILPMCVIKRFHDCLLPTHEAVLAANKEYDFMGELKVGFLKEAAGYQFYNTSRFTFSNLITDSENIEDNFHAFCPSCKSVIGIVDDLKQVEQKLGRPLLKNDSEHVCVQIGFENEK